MIRFRKSNRSDSLGTQYVFGLNLYDLKTQPTLDLIIGKRVFTAFIIRTRGG
jgi:hypothetical protein